MTHVSHKINYKHIIKLIQKEFTVLYKIITNLIVENFHSKIHTIYYYVEFKTWHCSLIQFYNPKL